MTNITVNLPTGSYDVLVAPNALDASGKHLAEYANDGRLIVISDDNVAPLWLDTFKTNLQNSGIETVEFILPSGEQSKSWVALEKLTDWLLTQNIERSDTLVALGGGVVGDITGFAASIIKRGCNFIQIPTSLLAQVDSSVGGKTAINSKAGKNLIGSFKQPVFVLIDPLMLETLPDRELRAGFAEVIKYGLIDNPGFFDWCETNGPALLDQDIDALNHAIIESVTAKAKIVAEDEKELTGKRALLNLGHTFAHALEAETGYSDVLVHGEAVAAGMALAFRYSVRRGHCDKADALRVEQIVKLSELPSDLKSANISASGEKLVKHMMNDKKMTSGTLPFLLANGIGKTFLASDVDLMDVAEFLDQSE